MLRFTVAAQFECDVCVITVQANDDERLKSLIYRYLQAGTKIEMKTEPGHCDTW